MSLYQAKGRTCVYIVGPKTWSVSQDSWSQILEKAKACFTSFQNARASKRPNRGTFPEPQFQRVAASHQLQLSDQLQ